MASLHIYPDNQPIPQTDVDLWDSDPALRGYVGAFGGEPAPLARFGAKLGAAEMRYAGQEANRNPPRLHLFDRTGARLDAVEFHPAYHQLMDLGLSTGYAAGPWTGGRHVTHAAKVYLQSQIEPGVACPMTMSYAAIPALEGGPAQRWRPKLTRAAYDPADAPLDQKSAATMGMAMTEKQGGSDVRSNQTRAEPDGEDYRLFGHKWFCSAPMSDGFLTLAQAPDGLTCFVVPRWQPDGTRNALHLMRLKDKLGNRSNASAEIEYHGAWAERLGEEGDGVRTIIRMVHHTRLDTATAPAGLMRAALSEAAWWCRGRTAFQKHLIDQPLMRAVLADLALDWEGATALALRVAFAFDHAEQAPFARIAVALAKFLNNKLCPNLVYEAMECLGGTGYTDDTPMPMFYREAPLNSIWEGSGNVICLDILRTLAKDKAATAQLADVLADARGGDRHYDSALRSWQERRAFPPEEEARRFAEDTATLLTAATLLEHAPNAVAQAYCATRLSGERRRITGTADIPDPEPILARL